MSAKWMEEYVYQIVAPRNMMYVVVSTSEIRD